MGRMEKAAEILYGPCGECDLVCDRSLKYYDSDSFASSFVDCCLERGKTLKNGGAKYDYVSQSNIGMSVVGDSLAVIKNWYLRRNRYNAGAAECA